MKKKNQPDILDHIQKSHDLYHEQAHVKRVRVLIESPFSGKTPEQTKAHRDYAHLCVLDSLGRGEAPYASHLFYTQMLDDTIPEERAMGIQAGLAWGEAAERTVVYTDLGVTRGMQLGIDHADQNNRPVEKRTIGYVYSPEVIQSLQPTGGTPKKEKSTPKGP